MNDFERPFTNQLREVTPLRTPLKVLALRDSTLH